VSAEVPTRGARLLAAFVVARVGFGLAYLVSSLRPTALFWYHPLLRAWTLEVRPADFAMDWYGRTALAIVAALVLGAGTFAAGAKGPFSRALARPSFVLGLAHAAALVVLVDFVYFGWVLTHQAPAPLPLPSWYCPR
jgi:hypothetical protein